MAKSKRKRLKKQLHIHNVKGRRFTDEIRNLDLERVLIVPIDGAKHSHKALAANYFGDIIHDPFEFSNSASGLQMFDNIVTDISSRIDAQKIILGLESTGHYTDNLYRNLTQLGYDVALVNPTSVYSQRMGQLNWCKTDERDLCAIGQVLIDNQATETVLSSGFYYNLKQLTRLRRDEIRIRARLKTKVKVLCDHIFPGLEKSKVFSDFWGKASVLLLEHYPTPASIIRLGEKRLVRFFKKNNTKLGLKTALRLINLAKNALTKADEDLEIHLLDLKFKIQDLQRANQKILELDILTAQYLGKTPALLLLSIKQVNVPSAAEFLAELGPPESWGDAKKITSRAGLNPSKFQTGKYESKDTPITKHGHNRLRYISLLIAQNLSTGNHPNPYFHNYYQRMTSEEHKDSRLVKAAIANKFIRTSVALMRDKKLFFPFNWTDKSITDDPIEKLYQFLKDRGAEKIYDDIYDYAKEQVPEDCNNQNNSKKVA